MREDSLIREHRTADVTLTVMAGGTPLANREVVVAQREHKFLFGNIGFDFIPLANDEVKGEERAKLERLAEKWLALYNFATLPFYWGRFEPERGRPDTARLLAAARWFADRGVAVKGHPLCWHTAQPDWLLPLSNGEILEAQKARIRREVTDFRGVIDTWDAINEAVIMPVFENGENGITRICLANGRIATVKMAFETARESNPKVFLLLNDFDMSTAYECLIEGVLEAGVKIDALGLQSHMHQGYWGEEKTLKILDRFARYGLPIHFTESTLVSGHLMPPEIEDLNDYKVTDWPSTPEGEARQADEMVRHYKTLLSHPAVEAMTYWDLADGGWLNAPTGLVRLDGSPKPAYDALLGLVKGEWWLAPTPMTTDAEGRLRFNGFLGKYEVSSGQGSASFRLEEKGPVEAEVRLDA
ncbi:MAG TPA: endo-1,4-beta-xylanase [Candidatus Limnocylindrales bacterium]